MTRIYEIWLVIFFTTKKNIVMIIISLEKFRLEKLTP